MVILLARWPLSVCGPLAIDRDFQMATVITKETYHILFFSEVALGCKRHRACGGSRWAIQIV